ncbi:MAG: hypothetical protein WB760_26435 [Xanthobacteraceae bacterium]
MDLARQKTDAVRGYLDRLKGGLPWSVERHRTDPTRGHIVDRFGNNVAANLSLGVAEFCVERVNREE